VSPLSSQHHKANLFANLRTAINMSWGSSKNRHLDKQFATLF